MAPGFSNFRKASSDGVYIKGTTYLNYLDGSAWHCQTGDRPAHTRPRIAAEAQWNNDGRNKIRSYS